MGLSTGFGVSQKPAGGGMPGPPFAAGSANNGLSVDAGTGKIVLGQDVGAGAAGPAALLSIREISTPGGRAVTLKDYGSNRRLYLSTAFLENVNDNTGDLSQLSDQHLLLQNGAGTTVNTITRTEMGMTDPFGDVSSYGNGSLMYQASGGRSLGMDVNSLSMNNGSGRLVGVDTGNGFSMSDAGTGSSLQLFVGGSQPTLFMSNGVDQSYIVLTPGGSLNFLTQNSTVRMALRMVNAVGSGFDLGAPTGITIGSVTAILRSSLPMNNGAAAALGTLTNAPSAGNPTKWIGFNDAGTVRYIPTW